MWAGLHVSAASIARKVACLRWLLLLLLLLLLNQNCSVPSLRQR
jgi:hypothetical protein